VWKEDCDAYNQFLFFSGELVLGNQNIYFIEDISKAPQSRMKVAILTL
jgi:hypothetical protein